MVDINTMLIVLFIIVIFLIAVLASAIKIMPEYQRIVIFRLGRLMGIKGPGLVFIIPIIDKPIRMDLRTRVIDVPKQRIITRDNVTVDVDAVVYFRITDPQKAIVEVQRYDMATSLLAQTTLRDILGQKNLDELLSQREELNKSLQSILDIGTDPWGIKDISRHITRCLTTGRNASGNRKTSRSRARETIKDHHGRRRTSRLSENDRGSKTV